MEKDINIAEILKDKSRGIKLYSPIFGDVTFDKVEKDLGEYTIFVTDKGQNHQTFMADGRYNRNGVSVLYPAKLMDDWSKFAWKKGDVLATNDGKVEVIFDEFIDSSYTTFTGRHYFDSRDENNVGYEDYEEYLVTSDFSIEAKEAAQCYINTIEERLGGKLDMETLEIEEAKLKYKFKPLEYVLSNDNDDNEWTLCQFSHIDKEGNTVFVGGSYADKGKIVLPYKGNEHLLGTTKSMEG